MIRSDYDAQDIAPTPTTIIDAACTVCKYAGARDICHHMQIYTAYAGYMAREHTMAYQICSYIDICIFISSMIYTPPKKCHKTRGIPHIYPTYSEYIYIRMV